MRNLARALLRLEEVDLLLVSKELCSGDRWGHGSSSLRDLARVATRCRWLTSANPGFEVPVEVLELDSLEPCVCREDRWVHGYSACWKLAQVVTRCFDGVGSRRVE